MKDDERQQRDRRRAGGDRDFAHRIGGRVVGKQTLADGEVGDVAPPAHGPGRRTLAGALRPSSPDPTTEVPFQIGRARTLLPMLDAANRGGDAANSACVASTIELAIHHARDAAVVDGKPERVAELIATVDAFEREARPFLIAAFRPTAATIRASVGGDDRTGYDDEAEAWRSTSDRQPNVADIATKGTRGPGERLPHFDRIQASFGSHDVSGVRAHIGGEAADATRRLGATAFAFGDHVAFASMPDLHTAAHEAAHHVQQRAGVALKGGIDQPGDEYEQHADQVADAVVRGESAAPFLDRLAGRGASAAPSRAVVQRKTDGGSRATGPVPRKSAFGMYLYIHEADLRGVIRDTLVDVAWPDPAPDVAWGPNGDRAFGTMVGTLVGNRLSAGESAIVQLLHPSDVLEYFHRMIKVDQANWSPEFGLGFAGLVARATIISLSNRIGPSFRAAVAHSVASPTVDDFVLTEPMDSIVAAALVRPGVTDLSNVAVTTEPSPPAKTGKNGRGSKAGANAVTNNPEPVPTREQLQDVDRKIGVLLDQIRTRLQPAGLASHIGRAYSARHNRMKDVATGDEAARARLAPDLQFQHAQLMTIAPQIGQVVTKFLPIELALKVSRDDARRAARDAMWSMLTRLVEAVNVSDHRDESATAFGSIAADTKIEDDARVQADLVQATQQAIASDGHSAPGAATAHERAEHQRQATLTGGPASTSKYERKKTETMAGEVALDSRMKAVERALVQLQAAAADAGFIDPEKLHKFVPNASKTVPELLVEVREHLAGVQDTWKHATIDGTPAVQEDPNAPDDWTDWQGRAAGLTSARDAFAKIAGDQGIGEFLRECADKIRHQQMIHAITTLAEALLITLATGMGAAALGRTAAAAIAAEESTAVAALTAEGTTAARAGWVVRGAAVATDIGINVSINSAVQFVQSSGQESLGWSMLENSLMEVFTRGLLGPLRASQKAAVAEAHALSTLPHLSALERAALKQLDFVGTEVALDLVSGMATQWAAHRIVTSARAKVEVSEPFAATVLQQGAAIALGKFFHGKVAAWHAHRAELERMPIGASAEAKALFAARDRFYARAKALAESVSPDPAEGSALQAENKALVQQEKELFAGPHSQEVNKPNAYDTGERRASSKSPRIDPSNDAARIQTKAINTAIEHGETRLDWSKPSRDGTTTLGAEYQRWIESSAPVDFSGPVRKANYNGHPDFAADIAAIVTSGNITLNLSAQANTEAAAKLHIKSLDPASPSYAAERTKLVARFGAEKVAQYEASKLGTENDPARAQVFQQVHKIIGQEAITKIREAFPDSEIYVTGSAAQPAKGKPGDLQKISDLDVVIVVPEGTDGAERARIEERAKSLSVETTPEFANATGKYSLPIDATARTQEQAFGLMTVDTPTNPKTNKPRTPLEYARIDNNLPKNLDAAKKYLETRQWSDKLSTSNPNKMTPAQQAADLNAYLERKDLVAGMQEDPPRTVIEQAGAWYVASEKGARRGPYKDRETAEATLLKGVSKERLELAAKGDARTGERVPLTYGDDPEVAKQTFHRFQAELRSVFESEGITDAVVVQLGSGTTGWSTAPGKAGKAWTPKSDVDFAIFSDQALEQTMKVGAPINPKNQQAGQYTTIWNNPKDGSPGFGATPLGKKLQALSRKWNQEIFKDATADGFDFKLNLSDKVFQSAVPVMQLEMPIPTTKSAAGTRAVALGGRSPFFGVPCEAPRMAGRIPEMTVGRREFHITVLSPPELASLVPEDRARVLAGVDIPGTPRGVGMVRHDIGDFHGYQMVVEWPEAQAFRKTLRHADGTLLGDKEFHVSLHGGIGDAVARAKATKTGEED